MLPPPAPVQPAVRLRIPKSHPNAKALLVLAERLATHQQTASGLVVQKILVDPEADRTFINALRDLCGVDPDMIYESLAAEKKALDKAAFLQSLSTPAALTGILQAALGGAAGPLSTRVKEEVAKAYLREQEKARGG